MRGVLLSCVCVTLFLYSCSTQDTTNPQDLTGKWRTESIVPCIYGFESNKPEGKQFEINNFQLVERLISIKWDLNQNSDGLITGINNWVTYNEKGDLLYEECETIIGAVNGQRIIFIEAPDKITRTVQVLFDCVADGPDRINCIGYSVGGVKLFLFRCVLVRE